ncbi:hypothetical protein AAFC00_001872 [Neodothiora populina]|uniref:Amine oxidase n=1 Tax=Neodothiora populina TaxID=2781224 RepID=A0ABR3PQF9_9PEZI
MYDILVVGAGLSGLQAATTAHQAGKSVLVVEARDRVGGKTWSVPLASGRGSVEFGAAWINDTNQRRMWAYAQQFGLEMVTQSVEGKCVMLEEGGETHIFPFGKSPNFSAEEVADLERIRDMIHDASMKTYNLAEEDSMTLAEYVTKHKGCEKTQKMVNLWTRVMIGCEHTECTAGFFIDYARRGGGLMQMRSDSKHGGQYLRFKTGSQSVAKGIAVRLPKNSVRLSTPVVAIDDKKAHVVVTSTTGEAFKAKKVIISLPTPLYKDVNFSPPLPAAKDLVTSSTFLGTYTKVILCYDEPWWLEAGYSGLTLAFEGPVAVARDTSVAANKQFSLTCFVNGEPGRTWSKLPQHERRAQVLAQIATMYGEHDAVYKPIEIFEQEWINEEFSKGAVCPILGDKGMLSKDAAYRQPVGNLHFVGTEFASEWKGYMEGALCSGEVGGQQAVSALQESPRSKL